MFVAWFCLGTFLASEACADKVFDFSEVGVNWPAGSLMQTYTDVDGSGVDIRITISGDVGSFDAGFPALDMTGVPGADDQKALWLRMDSHSNLGQVVTPLVEFFETGTTDPATVTNVSTLLLEIDFVDDGLVNMYRDDVRSISAALASNGAPVAGTASAITGGTPAFDIVDNGLSTMRLTGTANSPQSPSAGNNTGDVTVDFGASEIKSFTYSYGNRLPLDTTDPTLQYTALQSIHFLLVPEPSSVILALTGLSCLAFLAFRNSRRKKEAALSR